MHTSRRLVGIHIGLAAGLLAAVAGASPAQAYTTAKHAVLPLLLKHDYVGKPLRVVTIVSDDGKPNKVSTFDNRMLWFGHALVRSKWYTAASTAYNLGAHGSSIGLRESHYPVVKPGVTSADIQSQLRGWLNHAHVKPNPKLRSIYVMYLPCKPGTKIDIAQCGKSSYHPKIVVEPNDPNFTTGDSMVFVLMPMSHGKKVNLPVSTASVFASHEIIESATDTPAPGQRGYNLHSATPDAPFDVSPWVFNEGHANTEVGDMAGGSRISLRFHDPNHGYTYLYERFYTPYGARHHGDPFRPVSPKPFNSVSTAPGWFKVSLSSHQAAAITVRGWSTAKLPDWGITASAASWSGRNTAPTLPPDPCNIALDRATINNNQVATLTVGALDGSVQPGDWCAIKIKSSTADPAGVHNDAFHQWLVGVRFVS